MGDDTMLHRRLQPAVMVGTFHETQTFCQTGRSADMKVVLLAAGLTFAASSGNAHSIKSAFCNAKFSVGEPMLNILVQPGGNISGTGGRQNIPFTVRVRPDGTVDFFRPDGSLWYEGVTMADGNLFATFHQSADKGGVVGKFTAPCIMR
jgi:hypothetical protein